MSQNRRIRGVQATNEGIEIVEARRIGNNWTRQTLANRSSVSEDTLERLIRGVRVERETILRVTQVLGLRPINIVDPNEWNPAHRTSGDQVPAHLVPVDPLPEPPIPEPDSDFYVERPPIESICYQEILQPYALLRIKAPRRMGKTWLMSKVLNRAVNQGCRTVALNLRQAVDGDYTSLDQFLRWFCTSVSLIQRLPNMVDEHWDEKLGNSKLKCERYFEEYLLASERPLVLALDELDRVYPSLEIAEHFLGMLRTWYESAKNKEIWRRLRLVIVYVEDYPQMNSDRSPYNVGEQVGLLPFTEEQVCELVQMHELVWDRVQVTQLTGMVGGLPFLVHRAVSHLKAYTDVTLKEFLAKALTFEGIYSEHLQGLLSSLQQQPELVEALKQVVTTDSPVQLDWGRVSKLYGMGLVQRQGNQVTPSCELYRQFFREQL